MSLPDTLLARLIETVKDNDLGGSFVMLGRQKWVGSRRGNAAKYFTTTLAKYLPGVTEEALKNPDDAYTERFFETLGFSSVDSMDVADFEGASIVQDLSKPLDDSLKGRFDVVYDGGTCEHIFELPTAYKNIDALLKPGGVLIGHSPCNNWINHGFYQICPEMIYGFWERAMGYTVLDLTLQPLLPYFVEQTAKTTNPNVTGIRPRLRGVLPQHSPILLNYAVRKPATAGQGTDGVYQTDYINKWDAPAK